MSAIKNADDAATTLRSFIAWFGTSDMRTALDLLLAERDKLFTNGIEALSRVAVLQEQARHLAALQKWCGEESAECFERHVTLEGETCTLCWSYPEEGAAVECYRVCPSIEAAAGLIELGAIP